MADGSLLSWASAVEAFDALYLIMLLGAALQVTNTFGGAFLDDFKTAYQGSFGVEHPNLLLSISQISELLFVTIPFSSCNG